MDEPKAEENKACPVMSGDGESKDEVNKELDPWPVFIQDRLELWNQFKEKYIAELKSKNSEPISITLSDGVLKTGFSWKTTPFDVAKEISERVADNTIIAKVDNELWDLDRPLEKNCELKLLKFDDSEAEKVFWHSSAHILGEALERTIGGHLCTSPAIQSGFYYDMYSPLREIESTDYPLIEEVAKKIIEEKQPFERLEIAKEDLLEMFKYNKFKVSILNEKVTTPKTTIYRCGQLIDLCHGPHVQHTGKIKTFKVIKSSATYWEDDANAESLQRVYGISFPDDELMEKWVTFQEEVARRDHRKIGAEQELFLFHELSPGSCFFLPRGTRIYNTIVEFIRSEFHKRGYEEVITPTMFNSKLWKTSGHLQHYADNMISFEIENDQYALKPMNCPAHCLIFDRRVISWKELPLRFADFGVLHRNELSDTLYDLTRVKRFQQDDAHIFCTVDQIKKEIIGTLEFMKHVYSAFNLTYELSLSTRPKNFLGDIDDWNEAENYLRESLQEFGEEWTVNAEDGAFYGPKIDVTLQDCLERPFQSGSIQLDFQLAKRFNLNYIDEDGEKKQPVIIHRSILGSVERMVAILAEHFAGKWPFWLSPRQLMVIPVNPFYDEYGHELKQLLRDNNFMCDINVEYDLKTYKKINKAQMAQYNFTLVVGETEKKIRCSRLQSRDGFIHAQIVNEALIQELKNLVNKKLIYKDKVR